MPRINLGAASGHRDSQSFSVQENSHLQLSLQAFPPFCCAMFPLFEAQLISMIPKGPEEHNNLISEHNAEPTVLSTTV